MRQGLSFGAVSRSFTASFLGACVMLPAGTGAEQPGASAVLVGGTSSSSPIAVVELFTSESCPTCPSAERVLDELARDARARGTRLFAMAYHVDYWNRPPRDPLSDALFSARQAAYKEGLGLDERYTPQMIVNGRTEFVGSEREKAMATIREALARPARAAVSIRLEERATATVRQTLGARIGVQCAVAGATADANLHIALVEREARGNKSTPHANVVRAFKSVALKNGMTPRVELIAPPSSDLSKLAVVAFVQDTRTMAVLGASSADLQPAPASSRVITAVKPLP